MAQFYEASTRAFLASAAIAPFTRVSLLSTGKVAAAGAGEFGVGTAETRSFADNDPITVRVNSSEGTKKVIASTAITIGAQVYAAAAGRVAATGTICLGTALEAATANNDIIEILPVNVDLSMVRCQRRRNTIAEINAGVTLLPAVPGLRYRIVDASFIAIGGAASGATSVDLAGTQSATGVLLVANAVAGLTQNTLLRAGAANSAILAGGLSYVANDANTAITLAKTGSNVATATHVDTIISYVLES